MSTDGSDSPNFLNRAVPLGLYALLVVLGFYMLVNDGPPRVLAMLAVIAATLTYIFLAKPLRGGPESRTSLLSPELSSDLTKTVEIGARMDQIVADLEQLKRKEGSANIDALKRDLGARIEQIAAEVQEMKQEAGSIETADIAQTMNVRFEQVIAEIENLKQSGGSVDLTELHQELDTRLAQMAAKVEDVQQVGGGIDAQDLRREMDARLDALRTEIEDMREHGGVADLENIKEQLATLHVYQTSAALSERDRIDRISSKLNALQRVPDDVAKLKENQRLSETERDKIAAAGRGLEEQMATLQARLDETASVDRVQGWIGELREDMEGIENRLKDVPHTSDLKALSEEIVPQMHSLQKLVIELQDPTKIRELRADIEKIEERIAALAAATDVEMLGEHLKQQIRELSGIVDETDQTEAVQQLRTKLTQEVASLRSDMEKTATASFMEEAIDAVKAQMAEISGRLDGVTAKELEERFANLKNEIRKVKQALSAVPRTQEVHKMLSEVRAEASEEAQKVADTFSAATEAREALSGQISELRGGLAGLREKTQEIAALRTRLDETATVEHVKERLGELRETLGNLETRLAEVAPAEDLRALKEEFTPQIRALQKAVGEMLDPKKLNDLVSDVEEIKERLTEFVGAGDLETLSKDVRRQIAEMEKTVKDTDQSQAVRDLRARINQGLEDLKRQLSAAARRAEVEELTAGIRDQVGALSSRIGEITGEDIEERLSDMGGKISAVKEGLRAEGEARKGVSNAVAQMREKLSAAADSREVQELMDGMREELGTQIEKIEEGLAAESGARRELSGDIEDLAPRIEALQQTVGERKESTRLDDLGAEIEGIRKQLAAFAESSEVEATADEVKQQIAELRKILNETDQAQAVLDLQTTVRREIDDIQKQLKSRPTAEDVEKTAEEIRAQVVKLSSRVDELAEEGIEERIASVTDDVAALREKLSAAATKDHVKQSVAHIREETAALAARLDGLGLSALREQLSEMEVAVRRLSESVSAAPTSEDLQKAISEIREEISARAEALDRSEYEARFSELKAEIDGLKEALPSSAADEDLRKLINSTARDLKKMEEALSAVPGEVNQLWERLAELKWGIKPDGETEASDAGELGRMVADLRQELDALSARPPGGGVEAVEEQLAQLQGEVDKIKSRLEQEPLAEAAGVEIQEVASRIHTDVTDRLKDLEKDLRAEHEAQEDVSRSAAEEVREQVAELSARVDQLAEEEIKTQIAELREDIRRLKETASAAAETEEAKGVVEELRAGVSEQIQAIKDGLSAESEEREQISKDVAELQKQLKAVSQATAEIDQLWERLAEMKWGLTPAEPVEGMGMDGALDDIRAEIAEMEARLDALGMGEAQAQLSELQEDVDRLKESGAQPDRTRQMPPGPAAGDQHRDDFSERITEMTSLSEIGRQARQEAPQGETPRPSFSETERIASSSGEAPAGKVFHISDPTVQSLAATYADAVASLDQGLIAARDNEQDFDPEGIWQGAQDLVAALEEQARVLVSLTSRPYQSQSRISNHSVNVLLLTLRAAELAPISPDERASLGKAALFHDIGMMRLPQDVFAGGQRASDGCQEELRQYPEYSAQLLRKLGDERLCTLVQQAHEREDGTGFPAGLTGPHIHPLAKLLHVADVFDALIHAEGQSRPQPFEAMRMLEGSVDTSLNAEAFSRFREAIGAFPVGTIVELNTRERAKVIAVKPREMLRPAVAVLTDANGNPLAESRFLDLQRSGGLFMARALVDEDLTDRARDIL
ncbi:MAG: HD domain-containing protein [Planctomycetes bacterium]|nr:HD domain-containing protein [Planctomycetota bacterium]